MFPLWNPRCTQHEAGAKEGTHGFIMRIEPRGGTLYGGNKKTRNQEALSNNEASWTSVGRERLGKAPWVPTVFRCSKTLEQHGREKWELLCIFLSSLTSHLQDATEMISLGRQAKSGEERGHSGQKKKASLHLIHSPQTVSLDYS